MSKIAIRDMRKKDKFIPVYDDFPYFSMDRSENLYYNFIDDNGTYMSVYLNTDGCTSYDCLEDFIDAMTLDEQKVDIEVIVK